MKRMIGIVLTLGVLIFLAGCDLPSSEITSAEVEITNAYKSNDYVYIYYNLTNTCGRTIDYYKVYFDIHTSSGTITTWDNGSGVLSGTTASDWTMENIGSASLSSVTVHSVEVKAY